MGRQRSEQSQLFYLFNLEERIPASHLLRRINPVVTRLLADLPVIAVGRYGYLYVHAIVDAYIVIIFYTSTMKLSTLANLNIPALIRLLKKRVRHQIDYRTAQMRRIRSYRLQVGDISINLY